MDNCKHLNTIKKWNHSILNPQKWMCYVCGTTESVWVCSWNKSLNCIIIPQYSHWEKTQIWSLVGKYGINKAIIDSFLLQYQFELKCSCLILLSLRFDIYGNDCQEVRFFWTRDKYWILSCFQCNPEIDQYCLTIACNVPILSHILVYLVLVY